VKEKDATSTSSDHSTDESQNNSRPNSKQGTGKRKTPPKNTNPQGEPTETKQQMMGAMFGFQQGSMPKQTNAGEGVVNKPPTLPTSKSQDMNFNQFL
jgi:hypothetical protein